MANTTVTIRSNPFSIFMLAMIFTFYLGHVDELIGVSITRCTQCTPENY